MNYEAGLYIHTQFTIRMTLKDSSEFRQLLVDVENNIESIEKCSELFEHFLSNVPTDPSVIWERLERALLLLCAGAYQASVYILPRNPFLYTQ